jgi:hypothetical protein
MKWYKHLFIYLGCVVVTEVVIAGFFLLEQLYNEYNPWYMFAWIQIAIPFGALFLFGFMEAWIDADNEMKARIEWLKKVNKLLEEHKKENEDE